MHAGCTTAVEYALMGRCSVLYAGVAQAHVAPQTKAVSRVAVDHEALAALVHQPPALDAAARAALSRMVASFGARETASEAIAEFLAGIEHAAEQAGLRGRILLLMRNLQHWLRGVASPYQKQKFEDVPTEVLRERMAALAAAMQLPVPPMREIAREGTVVRIGNAWDT